MLFDCGATNYFVSSKFSKALDIIPDWLDDVYQVGILGGKILFYDSIYRERKLEIAGQELKAELIKL